MPRRKPLDRQVRFRLGGAISKSRLRGRRADGGGEGMSHAKSAKDAKGAGDCRVEKAEYADGKV